MIIWFINEHAQSYILHVPRQNYGQIECYPFTAFKKNYMLLMDTWELCMDLQGFLRANQYDNSKCLFLLQHTLPEMHNLSALQLTELLTSPGET